MASNCTKLVEVDRLYFEGNPRTPECLQIPAMVAGLKRQGFKPNHPLVLSEKPGDNGARYLVLVGNRRSLGLHWLRDNEPEEYQRILPGGKIPAVVHKGLTLEEEVDLRIDHGPDEDRVPLDEWSQFLAIQQLVKVGLDTQEGIAIKLGYVILRGKNKGKPNRSHVQTRVNLARLPKFVQDAMEKLCREGTDATLIRWADVPKLSKAFNAEFAEHPDGDGPVFQGIWQKVLTPPETSDDTSDSNASDPKELSPAEATKRAQAAASEGLRYALLIVTRQSTRNLAEIDTAILEGESAVHTLSDIRVYMGEKDFTDLVDVSAKHCAELAIAQGEEIQGEYVEDAHPPVEA